MNPKLLRYGRGLAGLTQGELAELVGLDRTTINKYETGTLRMSNITRRGILEELEKRGMGPDQLVSLAEIIGEGVSIDE
ncbi:helix-turn-helix transcriptional regulator [Saccharococcus sp. Marseille-Q5394]|uniref:helix-turn-helix transcriptional regulator n=1 Tax=Saccharococcus sp. Marseille-Q5394 TaxID=2972778 RepID=UPI0021C89F6B|nr:helix-turn-helix transcriptional regulator [Saccharococcus sp. Marseille-Q5394]